MQGILNEKDYNLKITGNRLNYIFLLGWLNLVQCIFFIPSHYAKVKRFRNTFTGLAKGSDVTFYNTEGLAFQDRFEFT